MPKTEWLGLLTVVAAGICQGSFMLPMKWTKRWSWENTWLIFSCTAYLICPWLLVLSTVRHPFDILRQAGLGTLLLVILFGVGWGIGAVTFGLGVAAIGLSLGFTVILGLAACVGTIFPLVFASGHSLSFARGVLTGASMLVMLAGVAVCSFAGRWKESKQEAGIPLSYSKGLALCVVSGILSACGNLGFFFGAGVVRTARAQGVLEHWAPNLLWAMLTLPLFVSNAAYSFLLLKKNTTLSNFRQRGTSRYFLYGALMGILWMGGFSLYGLGARQMGNLGLSLGWSILVGTMVMAANFLGIATGEWQGALPSSKNQLRGGLLLLLLAIAGLGYANYMSR